MRPCPKCIFLLLLLGTSPSLAQELQGFDSNALPLPVAASPFVGVRGAHQTDLGDLFLHARASYLLNQLSIRYPSPSPEGVESSVIDGSLLLELGMNVGLGAGFDAGLRMGATLAQWGPGVSVASGEDTDIATFGAADPTFELGWTADLKSVSIRPYAAVRIPWGRQDAFSGDPKTRGEWGVAGAGQLGRIEWGGEVGLIYRHAIDVSGSTWGSQLNLGGGMLVRLTESLRVGPELHLLPVLNSQKSRDTSTGGFLLPAEALVTARYKAAGWDLGAAVGTGIPLSSTGTDETSLTRGPTSPKLRVMLQFGLVLGMQGHSALKQD